MGLGVGARGKVGVRSGVRGIRLGLGGVSVRGKVGVRSECEG